VVITRTIEPSTSAGEGIRRFLDEVKGWVGACMARYGEAEPTGGHDQLTYTVGWEPYVRHVDDGQALSFLARARDQVAAHFSGNGMWVHGYWKTQEAHHGTEHFELFLGTLARLDPTDERTRAQLLDAAEHIGNWVDEIPAWYDEETGLFRSFYLGTEYVGDEGSQANVAAHLRFANICLIAYELSRGARYLRFAEAYLGRWAEAILASPEGAIPTGLTPSGPVYAGRGPEGYHRAVGQLNLEGNVGAVELHRAVSRLAG